MRLGITEFIDCAHHLPGHAKCGQLHGHTYKVEVVIEGSGNADFDRAAIDVTERDRRVIVASRAERNGVQRAEGISDLRRQERIVARNGQRFGEHA